MRRIDDRWGPIVCFVLRCHLSLKKLLGFERVPSDPIRTVLLVKFFGIGSILLATPMLRALRRRCPGARIVFLTFEANREMLALVPEVDEVIVLRRDTVRHLLADVLSARRRLRSLKVDVGIAFEFFVKFSTIVTYLSTAPRRIGFQLSQSWRDSLITDKVFLNVYRHVTEIFAELVRPLGVEVTDFSLLPLSASVESRARVSALLGAATGGAPSRIVCVNPNAGELSVERRWPLERFGELIDRALTRWNDILVVVIGAPSERAYVAALTARFPDSPRVLSLTGELSLDELIALFERADLLVTNDSGPLHVAEAVGLPTVSLFGPETPVLYGPRGEKHLVIWKGIYCSPCLNVYVSKARICRGENRCMAAISTDEVFQAVWRMFDALPGRESGDARRSPSVLPEGRFSS
ncbi:MAG: glycosyltransferase family 9 protein [Planctomycetota bacterium]